MRIYNSHGKHFIDKSPTKIQNYQTFSRATLMINSVSLFTLQIWTKIVLVVTLHAVFQSKMTLSLLIFPKTNT